MEVQREANRMVAYAPSRRDSVLIWFMAAISLAGGGALWHWRSEATWLQWAEVAGLLGAWLWVLAKGARCRIVIDRNAGLVLWSKREWWTKISGAFPVGDVRFEVRTLSAVGGKDAKLFLVAPDDEVRLLEVSDKGRPGLERVADQLMGYCREANRVAPKRSAAALLDPAEAPADGRPETSRDRVR